MRAIPVALLSASAAEKPNILLILADDPGYGDMHCSGGFKAEYAIEVSQAGGYFLTALVVTVQEGLRLGFTANDDKAPIETAVPGTVGKWEQAKPVSITWQRAGACSAPSCRIGSRGVTIKEFTLTRVK